MKRLQMPRSRPLLAAVTLLVLSSALVWAQTLGKATADFPNLRANKTETPFGRLVADSLQSAANSDVAFINAGALRNGTLEAGDVAREDLEPLLSFGEDDVVRLTLTGAQIRAALERAAGVYPTGSPAFLHCAGVIAIFDPNAPSGNRIISAQIRGQKVDEQTTYSVAMPVSLAEGAAGYFNIWSGAQSRPASVTLIGAIEKLIKAKGEVAPINEARFRAK
jgi:2',3'-cyclic-nucleotide 2'-phosphodiesterase (5'-nucleotidase family)